MRQDDLEKTQYMSPQERQQLMNQSAANDLYNTSEMPKVTGESDIKPPFPKANNDVRELSPMSPAPNYQTTTKQTKKTRFSAKQKKAALLGVGFVVAIFIGFMIAGYSQTQDEKNQANQQQLIAQQQDLAAQAKDLQTKRQELEQQKKDLEAKQKALETQAAKAQGRSEEIQSSASSSKLGQLVDKVTGQADKRQQKLDASNKESSQASAEAQDVAAAVTEAQQMLDDVDAKLNTLSSMQQEANQLKDKAMTAYSENKGTIDKALYYAQIGANVLADWLAK